MAFVLALISYLSIGAWVLICIFGAAWGPDDGTIKKIIVWTSVFCFPASLIPSIYWPKKWWWWGFIISAPILAFMPMGMFDWSGESPGFVRTWGGIVLSFITVSLFGGICGKWIAYSMNEYSLFLKTFFEICIHPRKVFQSILDKDENYFVWRLILFFSLISALSQPPYSFLESLPVHLAFLLGAVISFATSITVFIVIAWFSYWFGGILGGKGTFRSLLAAQVWSYPPLVFMSLIEFLPVKDAASITGGLFGFTALIIGAWSFVISLTTVSVAHKFSVWRSLTIFLAIMFISSFLFLCFLILGWIPPISGFEGH